MWKRLLERYFMFRYEPNKDEMQALLGRVDDLFERLGSKVKSHVLPGDAIKALTIEYERHLSAIHSNGAGAIISIDGTNWGQVGSERKTELYWQIGAIEQALLGLRASDLVVGSLVLILLVGLLSASALFYVWVHPNKVENDVVLSTMVRIEDVKLVLGEIRTELKTAISVKPESKSEREGLKSLWQRASDARVKLQELLLAPPLMFSEGGALGVLKAKIAARDAGAALETLKALETRFDTAADERLGEISTRVADIHTLQSRMASTLKNAGAGAANGGQQQGNTKPWDQLKTDHKALSDRLRKMGVTPAIEKLLGTLKADIDAGNSETASENLQKLTAAVDAHITDQHESYFYTQTPYKWLEIMAWSWFGVLVGVVFYMAKQLKLGAFDKQDLPSIAGEMVMAPIVTCVVFFLFSKTGITTFTPDEETIVVILGLAFLMGYAVRRTVGLLENLKVRLLPSP